MRDVREVGSLGLQFLYVFQRTFQPKVRLVRANTQAIEHQYLQITQAFYGRWRYFAQIRRVRKIVEAVSDYRQPPVNYFERRDLQITTEAKRRSRNHRVRNDLWQASAKMRRRKDVIEDAAYIDPGALVSVKAERAVAKVKRANVIESKDVVGVAMRHQDRVKTLQSIKQSLLAKVSRSVHDHSLPGMFDQHRHPQAFVPRIFRGAGFAIASDRRNTSGCAGAKEGQFHLDQELKNLFSICH